MVRYDLLLLIFIVIDVFHLLTVFTLCDDLIPLDKSFFSQWGAVSRIIVLLLSVLDVVVHVGWEHNLVLPLYKGVSQFPWPVPKETSYASPQCHFSLPLESFHLFTLTSDTLYLIDPSCLRYDLNTWSLWQWLEFPSLEELPLLILVSVSYERHHHLQRSTLSYVFCFLRLLRLFEGRTLALISDCTLYILLWEHH